MPRRSIGGPLAIGIVSMLLVLALSIGWQILVWRDAAILSRFRHPQRQGEEWHNERWFRGQGFRVRRLPADRDPRRPAAGKPRRAATAAATFNRSALSRINPVASSWL